MNDYNYKYKHKKRAHTRDESERREKVTSLRSSETELKKIQKNAKDAGMSVNNYADGYSLTVSMRKSSPPVSSATISARRSVFPRSTTPTL